MAGLKVLIVDDSLLFRELLERELMRYLPPGSRAEKAGDPFEARDKILAFDPDVMLLDVEMPRMDGIEFLKRLLTQYALPTVMLSGSPDYRVAAIAAGATDFVEKPSGHLLRADASFFRNLATKLITSSVAKLRVRTAPKAGEVNMKRNLIAIGSSTGGTEALASVLTGLHPPLPGIVIVQHIPPMFSRLFAERLNHDTEFDCKEGETGDIVKPNTVFVAPGDKHMRIKPMGGDSYMLDCTPGPRVNGHCPSVDVLFHSVAQVAGNKAVGVILTGMGNDGARGLLAMRQTGSPTLGQDELSCVVYGMPRAAYEIGGVEKQLSLSNMPTGITNLVRGW